MPLLHKLAGVMIVCAVVAGLMAPREHGRDRPSKEAAADRKVTAARAARAHGPGDGTSRGSGGGAGQGAGAGAGQKGGMPPAATAEARRVGANELGQVPVLMYHRIRVKPELSLDRSVAELREELLRLAGEGYVPITAAEFVTGFNVPAGAHPVVLTFDDASPGHFALDAQGVPEPDTAVGVLLEVARRHPSFRPVATFFINEKPFQLGDQAEAGLKWLTQHGFEIANHTYTHPDLSQMSRKQVELEISRDENQIMVLTGAHAVTLAYPFGSAPKKADWARHREGVYDFKGIFLAGWRPSDSPFAKVFDPMAVNRVRSEGKIKEDDCRKFCSTAWLDHLSDHPRERYTSDGDPATITYPASQGRLLAPRYAGRARVY